MEKEFKAIFFGNSQTGAKTSLIYRIVGYSFIKDSVPTIGIDYKEICLTNYLGHKINLQIQDTAGQEQFRKLLESYYKGVHCIVLGYEVTDKKSFDSIKNYHYDHVIKLVGEFL